MKTTTSIAVVISLAFAAIASAVTITDLGTLGGETSSAASLNDAGTVIGTSFTAAGEGHTFVYQDGKMAALLVPFFGQKLNNVEQMAGGALATDGIYYPAIYDSRSGMTTLLGSLGAPGGDSSGVAMAINSAGWAVGGSYVNGFNSHAFLYSNGRMEDIGGNDYSVDSAAFAINDAGQVVGNSSAAPGTVSGFIYENGAATFLRPFGTTYATAYDINNRGQVVGEYLINNTTRGYVYGNGQFTDFAAFHAVNTTPFSINDAGQVVGTAVVTVNRGRWPWGGQQEERAFLYSNGVVTELNTLIPPKSGWTRLVYAWAINNRGQITGSGYIDGQFHAFLLTP